MAKNNCVVTIGDEFDKIKANNEAKKAAEEALKAAAEEA